MHRLDESLNPSPRKLDFERRGMSHDRLEAELATTTQVAVISGGSIGQEGPCGPGLMIPTRR